MANASAGVCPIKEEFVIKRPDKNVCDDSNNLLGKRKLNDSTEAENDSGETKKVKNEDGNSQVFKPKNKNRGQNKARPKTYQDEKQNKPCPSIIDVTSVDQLQSCTYNNCKYIHNPLDYLKSKPKDIGETCHVFSLRGKCARGIACRFGSSHITEEGYNVINEEKVKEWKEDTKNTLQASLQIQLQKKKYNLSFAEKLVKAMDTRNKKGKSDSKVSEPDDEVSKNDAVSESVDTDTNGSNESTAAKKVSPIGAITDEDIIKLLPRERKTIDWRDKLYLSPLTTVGNLPFRRICKGFGVDITCGEMALCESLLKGLKQEWALVKRHECEDIFGAQICGNNVYTITKVSQLLQENTELDFIDLNLGCPIDLIYKQGGGSGMMHRLSSLEASVRCASTLLSVPFTVKMRTGVYQNKKIAHTIMPKVAEWGASLITLHGRSKEGRYTKSADWEYIETCAKAAAPCPVFGNGDIMSYEDYVQRRETAPTVQGVMIGRGALIKPWIFTEIKEQRLWDIRSNERFDILKKYTNYGLEHWGSDTQGVENTRRFLLEWLSFLYRYVPVGLLERPPQKINERPPSYFGRDDLETLMASGNCADWVKISEMLLGPVPDGFKFLPKHKANSY
ncbi:tRNA-dihydrouridine(47) synthase [NAD(P)(+)]-like [Pectinophora gossypiella]|uniref:tRNA-dihydrouridine(47) synthase [NAD(P)(+)]-like n=1 Tax=Pectinophora gossypiella TaxID=13191 RepID=UPI00214ED0C3|nr:tRNA-dihydrouridine(47) synthase [NAD(P)(+)]-like [Pectinophora gossypiella]